MKYCLAFVLFSVSLAVAVTGTISGTVVDERGVPERDLVLEYQQLYAGPSTVACCAQTKTDENGHFSFKIFVKREEDGTLFGGQWAVYPCLQSWMLTVTLVTISTGLYATTHLLISRFTGRTILAIGQSMSRPRHLMLSSKSNSAPKPGG